MTDSLPVTTVGVTALSHPTDAMVAVERAPDGEVSSYLLPAVR
jgi:hypothetical protein